MKDDKHSALMNHAQYHHIKKLNPFFLMLRLRNTRSVRLYAEISHVSSM